MTEEIHNGSIMATAMGIWRRRKWLLIASFLLVLIISASLIVALPSLYRSSTTILISHDNVSESFVKSSVTSEIEQRLQVVRQSILSRSRLQSLIDKFDLYPELGEKASSETLINRLRRDIHIDQEMSDQQWGRKSTVGITISYQNWDPELAARVANELASVYQEENETIRKSQVTKTAEFLKQQLAEVEQQLEEREKRVNDFKTKHLGELPGQEGLNMATLERLNSELRLNGEKQIRLMERRDELLADISREGEPGTAGQNSRLDRLKNELGELRAQYTEKYPEIIRLKKEIADLEKEKPVKSPGNRTTDNQGTQELETVENELARLRQQEQDLHSRINELQNRVVYTPKVEQELKRLTHDYDVVREEYLSLQKRYQDARLSESLEEQQGQQFQVLEAAIPPGFPAEPNRIRLLFMAFMLSLGFSGSVIFLFEQFDTSFHTLQDLRSFTRLPILGVIPRINTTADKWRYGFKFCLGAAVIVACVLAGAKFSYQLGQNGEQIVWMMASRGT